MIVVAFAPMLAAVGPSVLLSPAQAAVCSTATGVTVVVDFRELGGGITTGCATKGGGKSAAAIFVEAGVVLSYATRQPGFVCRVQGQPSSDPCVNASPPEAYWNLWWSGGSSRWASAQEGVQSLSVPAGGSVAWVWQQNRPAGAAVPPAIDVPTPPKAHPPPAPSISPSAAPSSSPTARPTPTASATAPTPTSRPTSSAIPTPKQIPTPTQKPSQKPTEEPTDKPTPEAAVPTGDITATTSAEQGTHAADKPGGVSNWVTLAVLGALAAIVAGATLTRRRNRS